MLGQSSVVDFLVVLCFWAPAELAFGGGGFWAWVFNGGLCGLFLFIDNKSQQKALASSAPERCILFPLPFDESDQMVAFGIELAK